MITTLSLAIKLESLLHKTAVEFDCPSIGSTSHSAEVLSGKCGRDLVLSVRFGPISEKIGRLKNDPGSRAHVHALVFELRF